MSFVFVGFLKVLKSGAASSILYNSKKTFAY